MYKRDGMSSIFPIKILILFSFGNNNDRDSAVIKCYNLFFGKINIKNKKLYYNNCHRPWQSHSDSSPYTDTLCMPTILQRKRREGVLTYKQRNHFISR